jgi:hypothetical protein
MTQTQSRPLEQRPEVNINIPIPAELHRRVKMAASADGLTLKDAVIMALEMWVTNG